MKNSKEILLDPIALDEAKNNHNVWDPSGKMQKQVPIKAHKLASLAAMNGTSSLSNIDFNKLIKDALVNKDITEQQCSVLIDNCEKNPDSIICLPKTLEEFRNMRVNYLISLGYDELDKKGLSEELKTKSLEGFQQLYFVKFGKHHSTSTVLKVDKGLKQEIENLIQYAIDTKVITPELAAELKRGLSDNLPLLKERILHLLDQNDESLKSRPWDELEKFGLLEELKKLHFEVFKKKFKEKFGIDYKGNKE